MNCVCCNAQVSKASAFVSGVMQELTRRGLTSIDLKAPSLQCLPIEQVSSHRLIVRMHCNLLQTVSWLAHCEQVTSLQGATHAFAFWEGIPSSGKSAFGRLFADAASLQVSCLKPKLSYS